MIDGLEIRLHPESRKDSIRRYAEKRRDRKEGKA